MFSNLVRVESSLECAIDGFSGAHGSRGLHAQGRLEPDTRAEGHSTHDAPLIPAKMVWISPEGCAAMMQWTLRVCQQLSNVTSNYAWCVTSHTGRQSCVVVLRLLGSRRTRD